MLKFFPGLVHQPRQHRVRPRAADVRQRRPQQHHPPRRRRNHLPQGGKHGQFNFSSSKGYVRIDVGRHLYIGRLRSLPKK